MGQDKDGGFLCERCHTTKATICPHCHKVQLLMNEHGTEFMFNQLWSNLECIREKIEDISLEISRLKYGRVK